MKYHNQELREEQSTVLRKLQWGGDSQPTHASWVNKMDTGLPESYVRLIPLFLGLLNGAISNIPRR
jgi:hypothetical protein